MTATLREDIHHSEKKIKNPYKDKITTINLWKDDIYDYNNNENIYNYDDSSLSSDYEKISTFVPSKESPYSQIKDFTISNDLAIIIKKFMIDDEMEIDVIKKEFTNILLDTLSFMTSYLSNNDIKEYILSSEKFILNSEFIIVLSKDLNIHPMGWDSIIPQLSEDLIGFIEYNDSITLQFGKLVFFRDKLLLKYAYTQDFTGKLSETSLISFD